jgi:hypothetical protein
VVTADLRAVHVEPPVADEVLLVEDCPIRAEEAVLGQPAAPVVPADVECLALGLSIGVVTCVSGWWDRPASGGETLDVTLACKAGVGRLGEDGVVNAGCARDGFGCKDALSLHPATATHPDWRRRPPPPPGPRPPARPASCLPLLRRAGRLGAVGINRPQLTGQAYLGLLWRSWLPGHWVTTGFPSSHRPFYSSICFTGLFLPRSRGLSGPDMQIALPSLQRATQPVTDPLRAPTQYKGNGSVTFDRN